jgi:argininosuccinate lyase
MLHLSRMCEELILWTSSQFDFIELGDAFCSGSSIMPQKKNPDVAELIRGKSGRVFGNLSNLMMLMKSQPLTYNRDMQEDKEPIFDSVDTVQQSLIVFSAMVPAIKVKKGNMETAAGQGYSTATDLAEYLVRKNIPFRDAHEIVGKSVQFALQQNLDLSALPLQDLKRFCNAIDDDVFAVLTVQGSVQSRNHLGGTAPEQVKQALERAKQRLQNP